MKDAFLLTAKAGLFIALTLLLCWGSYAVAKRLVVAGVKRLVRKSRTLWDDLLIDARVLDAVALLVPGVVLYYLLHLLSVPSWLTQAEASWLTSLSQSTIVALQRFVVIYLLFGACNLVGKLLNAANAIYNTFPIAKGKPIKGYLQLLKIFLFIMAGIFMIATLLGQSPGYLIGGLGAMTAVLMLIFRDTILSVVASLQIASNNMVRIGDWIEMPACDADGDVIDIALHTVKVQNWDKTVTTIPTHKMVDTPFRNWRGMSESGGRRIKRAIHLDMTSVRFCDEELLSRFARFDYLADYIRDRHEEIEEFNRTHDINPAELVNGRRMTNVGCFRAYVYAYLRSHPSINQEMTLLVRQLRPGADGLPIEIYAFSSDKVWANYESIQADIFDHILAAIPEFGLRVYQQPTGQDLTEGLRNALGSAPESPS